MKTLQEFTQKAKCSYLENLESNTHYKLIDKCSQENSLELIQRGYRRFGKMFFRPICDGCDECKSIKIDVKKFAFSKSQKRVIRKAKDFMVYIQQPTLTQEHLDLFENYHLYMKEKKGCKYSKTSAQNYYASFVEGHQDFGYEILYFDNEKLIGVDLVDILEDGISSIYFYYDPTYEKYSLGKLSLLNQILIARDKHLSWIYLGYYVKDNASLSYKAQYQPYLTLQGRPNSLEVTKWL